MQRPPNGPELWASILKHCPPGAFVAGGAVRDYLLGVEPKDIDVFAPTDAWVESSRFSRIDGPDNRCEEYLALSAIDVVQRGVINGWTVDLVYMSWPIAKPWTPERVVASFDFGLTRSWWDGDLHESDEAYKDRENRTVSLLLTDRPVRSRKRFERFNLASGGDWRLVEPSA